ncbi:MAG: ankyrin repeat domain-containing protein [Candidatus Micrarchaeota archaeon]|nr:ankyrin repeat domain-containing protein [Candidatus Micrarchaeota archaeon]
MQKNEDSAAESASKRYNEEARRALPIPSFKEYMSSLRIAEGVLSVSERACREIRKLAIESALERIKRPFGMTADDRVWFRQIVSSGLDPDSKNGSGQTMLMAASYAGDTETIKYLKMMGATIEPRDNYGHDAVDYAKMGNHDDVVALIGKEWPPAANEMLRDDSGTGQGGAGAVQPEEIKTQ